MATKRKFEEIRSIILENISSGQKTVNQISRETGVNWRTVDNHLVYLIGRGMISIVFESSYVKIYQITDAGRETLHRGDLA